MTDTTRAKQLDMLREQLRKKDRFVMFVGAVGLALGFTVGAVGGDNVAYQQGFSAGQQQAWSAGYAR